MLVVSWWFTYVCKYLYTQAKGGTSLLDRQDAVYRLERKNS
jgi:hypothetical protein